MDVQVKRVPEQFAPFPRKMVLSALVVNAHPVQGTPACGLIYAAHRHSRRVGRLVENPPRSQLLTAPRRYFVIFTPTETPWPTLLVQHEMKNLSYPCSGMGRDRMGWGTERPRIDVHTPTQPTYPAQRTVPLPSLLGSPSLLPLPSFSLDRGFNCNRGPSSFKTEITQRMKPRI